MTLPLKLDGHGALYRQLARALAAWLNGRPGGERLPSTRELAASLGVSRNTARAAYELLEADGLLTARRGSGSFPRPAAPTLPRVLADASLRPLSTFSKRARKNSSRSVAIARLHRRLRFNLQYGEPLVDVLFADVWRRELGRAAARTSLSYPDPQGLPALRQAICENLLRRRGVPAAPEDIVVVSGTQQALSLTARVLLNEGDRVVLENPCYFFLREVMQVHGARVVPVTVDRFGLVTERLPQRRASLICVTPSHQFPLGVVMAPRRREALLDYARRCDTWLLEDDYDSEFRYDGRHVSTLRAGDADDRVIYVGSLSKVLAPSLRMAFMVVPRALRADFIVAKRIADLGCPAIEQAALAGLLSGGGFERHRRRALKALTLRREVLLAGLARHAGDRLEVADSHAGMHLVAGLRNATESRETKLIEVARQAGLGLHPLSVHFTGRSRSYGLLLGYAGVAPAQITTACELLGRCLARL